MIMFGAMILCIEFKIRFVLEYFTFLSHLLGRAVFCLFLASMVVTSIEGEDIKNNEFSTVICNINKYI